VQYTTACPAPKPCPVWFSGKPGLDFKLSIIRFAFRATETRTRWFLPSNNGRYSN